jgi:hypothetical protein
MPDSILPPLAFLFALLLDALVQTWDQYAWMIRLPSYKPAPSIEDRHHELQLRMEAVENEAGCRSLELKFLLLFREEGRVTKRLDDVEKNLSYGDVARVYRISARKG